VVVSAAGVAINGGSLTSPVISGGSISGASISIATAGTAGTATLNSGSQGLEFAYGASTSNYNADGWNVYNPHSGAAQLTPNHLGLGYGYTLSITDGTAVAQLTQGSLLFDGVQVVSTRVSTTPATLADVIGVLQHHGLSN
jgi:hypothetical protein